MSWTISNNYLSESQMQGNALEVYKYFAGKGWTLNAIGGILGNMEKESNINPGLWQSLNEGNYSGGFGLVQLDTGNELYRLGEIQWICNHRSGWTVALD